jgi:hypothetical protein
MSIEEKVNAPEVLQRVIWIQTLTLIWMRVETVVSLGAAWVARSPGSMEGETLLPLKCLNCFRRIDWNKVSREELYVASDASFSTRAKYEFPFAMFTVRNSPAHS